MQLLDVQLVGVKPAPPRALSDAPSVLVLGVGNVLMGDEGVGIHVLRGLETQPLIPGVRLLDGGTGGVSLLAEFEQVQAIILIDATRDGRLAGTICYQNPQRVVDLPRGLGAHDFGVKDLFAASALIGRLPELHLYTVSVSTIRPMCMDLSGTVAAAVPALTGIVHGHAKRLAQATSPHAPKRE